MGVKRKNPIEPVGQVVDGIVAEHRIEGLFWKRQALASIGDLERHVGKSFAFSPSFRCLDAMGVDIDSDTCRSCVLGHRTRDATRATRDFQCVLPGAKLEKIEPLARLCRGDPARLAQVLSIGLAADLGLGVSRKLPVMIVVEIDFVGHRLRPVSFFVDMAIVVPRTLDVTEWSYHECR
jgi:hypothetical protein